MRDIASMISGLDRPRLLIQAARHAIAHYNRTTQLPRILGLHHVPRTAEAAMTLLEIEAALNEARLSGTAGYVATRHIDVLVALMTEARLLCDARPALTLVD